MNNDGKMYIVINTRFSASHCWAECPFEEVDFLRLKHRHEFHVTAKWLVGHDDRQLEFLMMKDEVEAYISQHYAKRFLGKKSCEMIAREIGDHFEAAFVAVYEDGENGAEYLRLPIN